MGINTVCQAWSSTPSECSYASCDTVVGEVEFGRFAGTFVAKQVKVLHVQVRNLTRVGWHHLSNFNQVVDLCLDVTSGPLDLRPIRAMTQLQDCMLIGSDVSNQNLQELGPLPNLRRLTVHGGNVSDLGVKTLSQNLRKLEMLDINRCRVTDACLQSIATLRDLVFLRLKSGDYDDERRLSDGGAYGIWKLPRLQYVSMDWNAHMHHIVHPIAPLRELDLSCGGADDWSVSNIASSFPHLIYLDVSGTNITDHALKPLCALHALQSLNVHFCKLTPVALECLTALPNLHTLCISSPHVEPVEHLAALLRMACERRVLITPTNEWTLSKNDARAVYQLVTSL